MQQIADWMENLGLPEYGERFAKNGIDVSVLPHLTDQDLKDMGVLLGHRRKMLAAIGELSTQPAPATVTPIGSAAIPTESPIAPANEAAGERRYLTVMFCDLVDSTGIAARLDAEEWRDPERDREVELRFGRDTGAAASAILAITKWQLGDVGPARALVEEAVAHAIESDHASTQVNTYFFKAHFETVRVMLELPGAPRKLSSNSAKRMRFRSLQLWERCNPLGQAVG
jgi:hypothetical protein